MNHLLHCSTFQGPYHILCCYCYCGQTANAPHLGTAFLCVLGKFSSCATLSVVSFLHWESLTKGSRVSWTWLYACTVYLFSGVRTLWTGTHNNTTALPSLTQRCFCINWAIPISKSKCYNIPYFKKEFWSSCILLDIASFLCSFL